MTNLLQDCLQIELAQHDDDTGSTYVRRIRVPHGWLYQTRESAIGDWSTPCFVIDKPVEPHRLQREPPIGPRHTRGL